MTDLPVDALAAYRITRLLQRDSFPPAAVMRDRVERRGGLLAEMYECPWCLGFWVSLGVVAARAVAPRPWSFVARALAASTVVGAIAERTYE